MTNEEDELKSLDSFLAKLAAESNEANLQESILYAQIASIRLDLEKVAESKKALITKKRQAERDRESLARKVELAHEAENIRKSTAEKRKQAEALIANAPWRQAAFDWQIDGALSLPERALNADKRGMGKTLSSIIWRRVHNAKKTLICLRAEVASDFIKELYIREPGLFIYPMLRATPDQRKMAAMLLKDQEEFVVVTNIESWRINPEVTTEDILKIDYDSMILDEAHHIKNSDTGTARGFFMLADRIPKVLELTGTPIKNRPQEMFSLLHALYPQQFERKNKFLADYCINMGSNRWSFTSSGLKSLVAKISHFYIARSPEDVGRLVPPPKIIEYKLTLDNHPDQKKAYRDITERSLAILKSGKVIPIVSQLAVMTRQAQIVSWPFGIQFKIKDPDTNEVVEIIRYDIDQSVKVDWADGLIKELVEEGERVILFSRFKSAIYELKNRLEAVGVSVAVITGDEKAVGNTEEVFNDFDLKTAPKNPRYQVLLATYATVGESANLNAARHMILYDRNWNPGNEDQAIGRIDRINSVDQATVHMPLVDNTIDDYMSELIDSKRIIVSDFKTASEQQSKLVEHLEKTL